VDVEREEKGLSLGAADYIRKPFSAAIVKLRLENQIRIIEMESGLKSSAEQLESALEEVQEATTAKSTFLSHMSHEIRTPLNAITGMGELLQHEHLESRQMGYVNDIVASAKSLINLINDIVEGNNIQVAEKNVAKDSHALYAPEANVLVVDDNELNRKVACGLLSLMKIEAETADSGSKALELVRLNDYDIIFMDYMMPEMNGIETTAFIRGMGEKYEHLPIIALTANVVPGARELFLANGFNDFVPKPVDSEELVRVLEDWLPLNKINTNVNFEKHQSFLNGEEELRRKSIVTFIKDNRDTFERITGSLSASDLETAHRIAHTLKSSAGYLGKKKLQNAALSLELSLRGDNPSYTHDQLDVLISELDKVLREFEPILKDAEAAKFKSVQIAEDELNALLMEIKPLLEKGDFRAGSYVTKLRGIAGMEELADKIDEYDFVGALELLKADI